MVQRFGSRCLKTWLALAAALVLLVCAGTAHAQYKPKEKDLVRPVATIKAKMAKTPSIP